MVAIIADKYTSQLERIKHNIKSSYQYFRPNYKRFHEYRQLVFSSFLNEDQKTSLNDLNKPVVEFNILEAYISRLLGEFSKHEPSIEVTPADGVPIAPQVLEVVEGHIRHIIYEANKNSCAYEVYKDLLSGGFSVIKVWTDYASPMSFDQVIKAGRVFDPTLCGFDPMARHSHKGDGSYSFELYPKLAEDFAKEYPGFDMSKVTFERDIEGFSWSYKNEQQVNIVLMGEYFEKRKKKAKIVKLSNGRVMTDKNYQKFEAWWKTQGFIEQIPMVVGKPRNTELETVDRYLVTDMDVIEHAPTDFSYLPHIFVDGNSVILNQGESGCTYQMTRPYVYHAKGIQEMKNFAGQCLGAYLENMVQHKFIVKKEAVPQEEDLLDYLTDMQHAANIVVNAYSENNPDKPIPDPIREVVQVPPPQEIMGTFTAADNTVQTILGSYDASLGINDNQLSGVAIVEGATQANAAAMPYVVGYLQAWTQLGNVIVDLMPKRIKGKRTLPVVDLHGKKDYKKVNGEGLDQPVLDYDANAINVNITAGVNFMVAKNKALQQIIAMMQASESFAQFMNTKGLPILIHNMTIHGVDSLEELAKEWQQETQQAQQQQQQMQQQMMQNDPRLLDAKTKMAKVQQDGQLSMAKLQSEDKQRQFDNQVRIAELSLDKQNADVNAALGQGQLEQDQVESAIQVKKAEAEMFSHAADAAAKIASHHHSVKMDHHGAALKEAEHALKQTELSHQMEQSKNKEVTENGSE